MTERKKRISASLARTLVTYTTNKSPDWSQKIKSYLDNKFPGNKDTAYGVRMETFARKCYERITDYTVTEAGLCINPKIPWLCCSLDGLVIGSHTIEIKCPSVGKSKKASEMLKDLTYIDAKDINDVKLLKTNNYYCQVQLGMFISNLKNCHFILYSSENDSCFFFSVPFDEQRVVNGYLPKLQYVYFSHMLKYLSSEHDKCHSEENG